MTENKTILRLKHKVSVDLYTLLTTGRVLFLTLNRKWYVKIASGEKKEEYRALKPYWLNRLLDIEHPEEEKGENKVIPFNIEYDIIENGYSPETVLRAYSSKLKEFDLIVFLNGYGEVPTIIIESKGIEIKTGREDWGALAEQFYLTLKLGEIRYSEPCS